MKHKKEIYISLMSIGLLGSSTFLYSTVNSNVVSKNIIVSSVIDGDTIKIKDSKSKEYSIRLACIDAPELNQNKGTESKDILTDLLLQIEDPKITLNIIATDKYNRLVSEVYLNKLNLNQHLVAMGAAVVYPKYFNCVDKDGYLYSQKVAKDNKLNVWSDEEFIMPWVWRSKNK